MKKITISNLTHARMQYLMVWLWFFIVPFNTVMIFIAIDILELSPWWFLLLIFQWHLVMRSIHTMVRAFKCTRKVITVEKHIQEFKKYFNGHGVITMWDKNKKEWISLGSIISLKAPLKRGGIMGKKKSKIDKVDIGYWISVGFIFICIIGIGIRGCKLGTNPNDYKNICLEGHVYHTVNFGAKMAVAIKLDDEGRPISCP